MENRGVWRHRDFLKEKIRVRERYWRQVTDFPIHSNESNKNDFWIIPDGISWRRFLPLLKLLVEESVCNLVLLESSVELMDYRSMSPCIPTKNGYLPEKPASQERSKISKLVQQHPGRVFSLCDLSIREEEEDEWDLYDYSSLSIFERCQHALLRAGRIIRQYCSGISDRTKVFILCSEEDFAAKFPSEDGVDLIVIDKLIDLLLQERDISKAHSLIDLKTQCEEDYLSRNFSQPLAEMDEDKTWKEHLTESQTIEGLKNKTLLKGRLEISKNNSKEAFVNVSNGLTYFIDQQLGHFNRAFHHDVVIIKPLPKSAWGKPIGRRRLVHHKDDEDDNKYAGHVSDIDSSPAVPSGLVVAIAEPSRREFIATMVDIPLNDESACLVIPMDVRIPKIRIKTNSWKRFIGQRLLVHVDTWDVDSNYPSGHCQKIIGPIGDLEAEIACLLNEHQIHLQPFSAAALACLPPEGHKWKIPSEEIERRLDLRTSHRIFSVDPPGCQDIDDTMHVKSLPNGDIEVGVHIADVTYFVKHNSPLDLEAQIRGTTFYLVDRRFDMLPSLLSSDLCSLHGSTDKLAVSTIWTFSNDFEEVKSFWHGRSVIHNCQAMTYEQAHNILHDKEPDDTSKPKPPPLTAGAPVDRSKIHELKEDLSLLTKLARKLRKDREETGGAVDLSSGDQGSELKFTLDKNNNPLRVAPKKQLEIHHTIAELMILSNTYVARRIHEKLPSSALLRVHQSVEDGRFEDLKEVLEAGKIEFDGQSNMALANSLKEAEKATNSNSVMTSLFQSLATRAMSEAQYVCTGQIGGTDALSHYGLGLKKYTHFTSPIRRYADVVVHKQLLLSVSHSSHERLQTDTVMATQYPLRNLPNSKTISILHGEGVKEEQKFEAEAESIPVLQAEEDYLKKNIPTYSISKGTNQDIYHSREVSRICSVLNHQNRMAKMSSLECQSLYLSLYFKNHSDITMAVVTNLRANGFWVYVPKFDMRGAVYLTDANGSLQIDPRLLNLDESIGQKPSLGFKSFEHARMIPSGKCSLLDDSLEITASETKSKFLVRVLDVLTIKISCDAWDVRARIPRPRIHLLADSFTNETSPNLVGDIQGKADISSSSLEGSSINKNKGGPSVLLECDIPSIYRDIQNLEIPPILSDSIVWSLQKDKTPRVEYQKTISGRLIFGNFRNPDTKSAMQEASIEEASKSAEQRRKQIMETQERNNAFTISNRIEKDATARMQRLQANKRNARKSKGR